MWLKLKLLLVNFMLIYADATAEKYEDSKYNREKRSIDGDLATCTPGSKWYEECNRCVCTDNGRTVCTNWLCHPRQPDDIYKTWGSKVCHLGEVWMRSCNLCMCTGFGRISCTEKDCSKTGLVNNLDSKSRKRRDADSTPSCVPGTSWKDECNNCFCSSQGISACTRKLCFLENQEEKIVRDKRESVTKCTPGSSWKDDCNNCFCGADGTPACTYKACVSNLPQQSNTRQKRNTVTKCTPGDSWKEDCNNCFCGPDGQGACTLMACPSHYQQQSNKQKREAERNCVPGTTWKKDCNTCVCTLNGIAACTLMGCIPPRQEVNSRHTRETDTEIEVNPDEAYQPTCKVGETIRIDCNICYCTELGLACTRRLCHGIEQSVTLEE